MLKFKKLVVLTVLITTLLFLSGVIMAQSPPGNPNPGFEFPGQGEFPGYYNPFLPGEGDNNPGQGGPPLDNPGQGNGPGNGSDYGYFDLDKEAYIYQNGDYNQGSIYQNSRHQALIKQIGENNSGNINQYGEGNFAAIKQYGSDNVGEIDQNGYANLALIGQLGMANQGFISQNGNENTALILQVGDNNQANIEQNGDNLGLEVMLGL